MEKPALKCVVIVLQLRNDEFTHREFSVYSTRLFVKDLGHLRDRTVLPPTGHNLCGITKLHYS